LETRTKFEVASAALLLLLALPRTPLAVAFSSSQVPAIRIGEHSSSNYQVLNSWGGLAFDPSGDLWVADSLNNRVLEFRPPFSDNMNAATVIGQPNFQRTKAGTGPDRLNNPGYVTFDAAGDLWVSDNWNNRLTEFRPPLFSDMNASVVIGQENFTASSYGTTQNTLFGPGQTAFDSTGNLWVPDGGNSRILEYQPPFDTGMNASLVLGEPDFTGRYCDPHALGTQTHCSNHSSLNGPSEVAFDPQGNLWVPESFGSNFGIAVFKPPFTNAMHPSMDFESVLAQNVAFDRDGNLWIACTECGHVAEYKPPFTENGIKWPVGPPTNATTTLGGGTCCTDPDLIPNVISPTGLAFDSAGNLWLVDFRGTWLMQNLIGRVVGYDAQVHRLATKEGLVYFENSKGLLAPLSSTPISQMDSLSFPHGLFDFTIQGLNSTESAAVTISFPNALPPNVGWWFNQGGSWVRLPASQVSINGVNVSLTLTGASNGAISMLGGPALGNGPAQSSSTTSLVHNSTGTSTSLPNIRGFPPESIGGGIIAGLTGLAILRYRRHRQL